jgi:hypothetical protein
MATKSKVAAYLPLSTLLTALDHLKAISIPNKIDSGTFPSMSSQLKSQLLSGLRFFELIDDEGTPAPLLSEFIEEKERKRIMKELIQKHYADIVALDFAKITPKQLDETLSAKHYSVQGDTKKKAKTFLLKAAQYAGFTVHPLLTKITRNRKQGGTRRTATNRTTAENEPNDSGRQPPPPPPPPDPNTVRMPIALAPGRIAYLELPDKELSAQDAKKLLGLLKISLDVND